MKARQFTAQIKTSVVDENVEVYRSLFETTEKATDPYWRRALRLYRSLDEEQRDVFFEVLRQVAADTVSSVFAVIDGVSRLDGQDGDCALSCGRDQLGGELQDYFLEHFND